jgi:penicillin-binding protein 1A
LFACFLAFFVLVSGGLYYLSQIPLPTPPTLAQTTFVYDANGGVLATFSDENRILVDLKQVPTVVINAVLSTEDRHFFTEGGLNPVSIVRAFISDIRDEGNLQGASTITQQYVKKTYLTSQRTISRKIKEASLAIRLARSESKDTILQDYLNTIYWGRGAYGVDAAAEAYFGKDVTQLDLPEASLLAGLIRQPDTADPAVDPAQARLNQDDTLRAMVRDHQITEAQADAVEATPFSKYVIAPTAPTGIVATVPGDQYFVAEVQQELYNTYGRVLVDSGGLHVTTTLNPTLQSEAYNSIYGPTSPQSLNPAGGDPSGALVSIDDTGAVRALVGGQNYQSTAAGSKVDLALGAQGGGSGRQAGSTFKAFMLAYLIKEGYSVESEFPAPKQVILPHGNANGTPWTVQNFEGDNPPAQISLVEATADSINTVFAQIVADLGANNLDKMAEAMGIPSSELATGGCPCPSQVLGTAAVSPLQMAAGYSTFADGGVYHQPYLISKVTMANGKSLPLPVQPSSQQVLTSSQAALESYVLQQVVLDGTGTLAGGLGTPIAGKTGTTQNAADAWFIGFTPNLTTSVWMGYAAGETPMETCPPGPQTATTVCVGFRGIPNGVQGGTIPAELWHTYMAAALASFPSYGGDFPAPTSFGTTNLAPPGPGTVVIPTTTTTTTTTVPTSTTTTTTPGSSSTTTTSSPTTTVPTSTATTTAK